MHRLIQFAQDSKHALRSLSRAKGLSLTVIITLALGIGANAAIFQSGSWRAPSPACQSRRKSPHLHSPKCTGPGRRQFQFSLSPKFQTVKISVHSLSEVGDFSVIGFTLLPGLGEPREIQGGVIGRAILRWWACTPFSDA